MLLWRVGDRCAPDARHGLKKIDLQYLETLDSMWARHWRCSPPCSLVLLTRRAARRIRCKFQLVLTKCDLLPRVDVARQIVNTLDVSERWRLHAGCPFG